MRLTVLAASVSLTLSAIAQSVPTSFVVDTLISSGLTAPNDFCFLPDGRVLIANRPGGVSLWANGTLTTVGTVPNVEVGSERALLSVAADPNFATNGYIYVWYSSSVDAFMHLDRFTCTGDIAVPGTNLTFAAASRCVILQNVPDNAFNHNGGSTRFGPDGMLYQSIGDDASGTCQQQNLVAQQGVLLRMNVSTLPPGGNTTPPTFAQIGPADNPLAANTDFSRLLIAHGLRYPVRFTIDPNTNNLYIGDVGQNAHEEYDEYVYTQGAPTLANFGWPWREGAFAAPATYSASCGAMPPTVLSPLVDIPIATGWSSVMGGPRYRNRGGQYDFGASYEGMAFYGDYFAGVIRLLQKTGGTWSPAPAVPGQPSPTNWAQNVIGLVSYDVGPDGAIYFLQHPSTYATAGGFFKRVRPLGPVDEVVVISGSGQRGPASEPFADPVVVQVNDPGHAPRAGVAVNFSVGGSATLSTTNPVLTDSFGRAQTFVTAGVSGGTITITATTPGGLPTGASASLFGRRMAVTRASNIVVITVSNQTDALPAQVPMVLVCSSQGIPPLQTFFGPVCANPFDPTGVVIEDSIGLFSFTSMSGTGAMGTPSVSKVYTLAPGFLVGAQMLFSAAGYDPLTGWWRTNCEVKTL